MSNRDRGEGAQQYEVAFGVAVESRVLLFALVVAASAGMLAGALPALRESRLDPAAAMRASEGGSPRSPRALDVVLIGQVAVSFVVLIAVGLLGRSLQRLRTVDVGFPIERALTFTVDPSLVGYAPPEVAEFYRRLLGELSALPGVVGVTRSNNLPNSGTYPGTSRVTREDSDPPDDLIEAAYFSVEPGWFETLGVDLLQGCGFEIGDSVGAPRWRS